jgi:hypothetical protein
MIAEPCSLPIAPYCLTDIPLTCPGKLKHGYQTIAAGFLSFPQAEVRSESASRKGGCHANTQLSEESLVVLHDARDPLPVDGRRCRYIILPGGGGELHARSSVGKRLVQERRELQILCCWKFPEFPWQKVGYYTWTPSPDPRIYRRPRGARGTSLCKGWRSRSTGRLDSAPRSAKTVPPRLATVPRSVAAFALIPAAFPPFPDAAPLWQRTIPPSGEVVAQMPKSIPLSLESSPLF